MVVPVKPPFGSVSELQSHFQKINKVTAESCKLITENILNKTENVVYSTLNISLEELQNLEISFSKAKSTLIEHKEQLNTLNLIDLGKLMSNDVTFHLDGCLDSYSQILTELIDKLQRTLGQN